MIVRGIILIISMLLHFLTPGWFLGDYLTIGDWLMVASAFLSLISHKLIGRNGVASSLSLILSLNVLVFFIGTGQTLSGDLVEDRAMLRLESVLEYSMDLSISAANILMLFNLIQIFLAILLGIVLAVMTIRFKLKRSLAKETYH